MLQFLPSKILEYISLEYLWIYPYLSHSHYFKYLTKKSSLFRNVLINQLNSKEKIELEFIYYKENIFYKRDIIFGYDNLFSFCSSLNNFNVNIEKYFLEDKINKLSIIFYNLKIPNYSFYVFNLVKTLGFDLNFHSDTKTNLVLTLNMNVDKFKMRIYTDGWLKGINMIILYIILYISK